MLAVEPTDLGCIHDPKYTFKLELDNYTPIQDKAIVYPPTVEAWLGEQLDAMEASGRIQRVGPNEHTPIVTALVLVP